MNLDIIRKQKEFLMAERELGSEEFNKHFREVFGNPCLDFVNTIVINYQNHVMLTVSTA